MTDKERWLSLPDEEKQQVLDKCLFLADNFNYEKMAKTHDLKADLVGMELEHPVLLLELAEPRMAHLLPTWLYSEVETSKGRMRLPFMGYFLNEITLDKSSLMNYTSDEREILRQAIRILREKGVGEEQ